MNIDTLKPDPSIKNIWHMYLLICFLLIYIVPIISLIIFNELFIVAIYTIIILPWFLLLLWWIPAFYNTIKYSFKDDHVEIIKGVWWQQNKSIPFSKITDIEAVQGPLQRYFTIGSLFLQTAGRGASDTAEGKLIGLTEYNEKQQYLLKYIRKQYHTTEQPIKKEEHFSSLENEGVLKEILTVLKSINEQLKKND